MYRRPKNNINKIKILGEKILVFGRALCNYINSNDVSLMYSITFVV